MDTIFHAFWSERSAVLRCSSFVHQEVQEKRKARNRDESRMLCCYERRQLDAVSIVCGDAPLKSIKNHLKGLLLSIMWDFYWQKLGLSQTAVNRLAEAS